MHYSHESKALQKPPRVSRNRTCDPSPNGTVTAAEEKGGGAHRRRGCSGEGSGEVQESLAITSRCGSPAMVVGGGRSTRADGGARRRRGVRPNQGTIDQLNGSGSFTRDQRRCVRENLRMAHRIARSTRGRERPKSGEDDLGSPVRFCRVQELGKLHGPLAKLTEGQMQLGRGWSELAAVSKARAVMAGGVKLAGVKEGRLASEGEHGVR
jgi:hypothetical protein